MGGGRGGAVGSVDIDRRHNKSPWTYVCQFQMSILLQVFVLKKNSGKTIKSISLVCTCASARVRVFMFVCMRACARARARVCVCVCSCLCV